jgi:hypothetical protein
MQGWASLQCSSSSGGSHKGDGQPAQQVPQPQPFTPWGPAQPAGLAAVSAATHAPAALQSDQEADQDPAAEAAAAPAAGCAEAQSRGVPGSEAAGGGIAPGTGVLLCGVVKQAAAATAAWALRAFEEQMPWFQM